MDSLSQEPSIPLSLEMISEEDISEPLFEITQTLPPLKKELPPPKTHPLKKNLPLIKSSLPPLKKSPLPPLKSSLPPLKSSLPPLKKSPLPPLKKSFLPPIKSIQKYKGWEIFDDIGWNIIDEEILYYDKNKDIYLPLEKAPKNFINAYHNLYLGNEIVLKLLIKENIYVPELKKLKNITPEKIMKFLYKFYNTRMSGYETLYELKTNKLVKEYYGNKTPSELLKNINNFLGFEKESEDVYIIKLE